MKPENLKNEIITSTITLRYFVIYNWWLMTISLPRISYNGFAGFSMWTVLNYDHPVDWILFLYVVYTWKLPLLLMIVEQILILPSMIAFNSPYMPVCPSMRTTSFTSTTLPRFWYILWSVLLVRLKIKKDKLELTWSFVLFLRVQPKGENIFGKRNTSSASVRSVKIHMN